MIGGGKGNMMAILDRRFSLPVDGDLTVELDGARHVLTPTWFLVARRSTLSACEGACPAFSENVRRLAFEDVVDGFGGREPFNALVAEILAIDFIASGSSVTIQRDNLAVHRTGARVARTVR
jgi:hypothetical protein